VHCDPTGDENGSDTSSRSYRILFPFQEAPETEDMWWELDRGRDRWRTVSWNVYDPDYHEEHLDMQAIETSNGVVENETAIVKAACRLSIGIPKEMVESKQWFDSHCVNDEFQQARNLLSKTGNTSVLINEKLYEDDKPLLVSVTEEGHHTIIDLLIQHGADLEVRDSEGYTALLRAVFHGHGTLAEKLLAAGSREDLKNNEGETLSDITRKALQIQRQHIVSNRILVERSNDEVFSLEEDQRTKLMANVEKREQEVLALLRIIDRHDRFRALKQLTARIRRVGELYSKEQAESVDASGRLDDDALRDRLLRRVADTPITTIYKTVACLTRGSALPWVFAISGYSSLSSPDGALHRETWNDRVYEIARRVGYTLSPRYHDKVNKSGSYLACHSEKQLPPYFLWNHSTILDQKEASDLSDSIRKSEPPSISRLHPKIYISQPGRETAEVCSDCLSFCQAVVNHYKFRLTLLGIEKGRPKVVRELRSL